MQTMSELATSWLSTAHLRMCHFGSCNMRAYGFQVAKRHPSHKIRSPPGDLMSIVNQLPSGRRRASIRRSTVCRSSLVAVGDRLMTICLPRAGPRKSMSDVHSPARSTSGAIASRTASSETGAFVPGRTMVLSTAKWSEGPVWVERAVEGVVLDAGVVGRAPKAANLADSCSVESAMASVFCSSEPVRSDKKRMLSACADWSVAMASNFSCADAMSARVSFRLVVMAAKRCSIVMAQALAAVWSRVRGLRMVNRGTGASGVVVIRKAGCEIEPRRVCGRTRLVLVLAGVVEAGCASCTAPGAGPRVLRRW